MSVLDKLCALVEALRLHPDAFRKMPPAERQRLAQVCRYIADKAEPTVQPPKSGVLADLRKGLRPE